MAEFKLDASCSNCSARSGTILINNKKIQTPIFMPVGTYGAVKTLSPDEISSIGYNLILANTYHIYLRPGIKVLKAAKGLHNFMNWNDLILTDSGGFQIYSLKGLRKIEPDGAIFQSHLDGNIHKLTPKSIVDIQRIIGSDIMMMLDVCPSGDETLKKWEKAVDLTSKWAKEAMSYFNNSDGIYDKDQLLVPIVQGGTNKQLRKKSVDDLLKLEASIYAIGGLAVGEPKEKMLEIVSLMNDLLPKNKPRYLMGVGTPSDILGTVKCGIDMFDCVMPTRSGRTGLAFTWEGKINLKNSKFRFDKSPLDPDSKIRSLNSYSKSYLHHLIKTNELLASMIISLHNVNF